MGHPATPCPPRHRRRNAIACGVKCEMFVFCRELTLREKCRSRVNKATHCLTWVSGLPQGKCETPTMRQHDVNEAQRIGPAMRPSCYHSDRILTVFVEQAKLVHRTANVLAHTRIYICKTHKLRKSVDFHHAAARREGSPTCWTSTPELPMRHHTGARHVNHSMSVSCARVSSPRDRMSKLTITVP